jgi:putative endonuclease
VYKLASQNGHLKSRNFLSIVRPSAICHPERSIALGLTNRSAQSRDPLWAIAMKDHCYSVYMIASKSRAIYIGMANDLTRRVFEHKNGLVEGFTKQYRCHRLGYYESFDDAAKAIDREKQLRRWSRVKKVWLIER